MTKVNEKYSGKTKKRISYGFQYAFLGVISLISIFPFIWMIIGATNKSMDITMGKMSFGNQFFINLNNLLNAGDLLTCIKNSAFLSIIMTVLSMLICSMAGYGFVVFRSKAKEFCFSIILLSMMIPSSSIVIPMFKMFSKWDY